MSKFTLFAVFTSMLTVSAFAVPQAPPPERDTGAVLVMQDVEALALGEPEQAPPPPAAEREMRGRDRDRGPRAMRRGRGGPEAREGEQRVRREISERLRNRMHRPLSAEEEEQALDIIREYRPWEMPEVERLKGENPASYIMTLRRAMMEHRRMERLKEEDPEGFERRMQELQLERHEQGLAKAYREADSEEKKAEIKQELEQVLGKHFDLRTENHRREIERVKQELERLQKRLETREENREQIIDIMSSRLVGLGDPLEF